MGVAQLTYGPCYIYMSMRSVFKRLSKVLHAEEYMFFKDDEEEQGDELCSDVVKQSKRVSVLNYFLPKEDEDSGIDTAAPVERDDGVRDLNGSIANVLDFVFTSPTCKELYISTQHDGRGLADKFIKVNFARMTHS